MKITNYKKLKNKKLIVFDLDGTLVETKSPMDKQMALLMGKLLVLKHVAVIGGGRYEVFQTLLLRQLKADPKLLKNLSLFPTTSTRYYKYNHGWKKVYAHELSKSDRKKIVETFHRVFKQIGYRHPKKTYGKLIEDRKSQVTFSIYGQDIVTALGKRGVQMKLAWTKKNTPLKLKIAKLVGAYLPHLEVRAAGYTSIDVTKKGIDKAYGLRQIEKYLKVKIKDMVFIGDAIFPGGNDYAALKTGVDYVPVKTVQDTKKVIQSLIA